MGFGVLRLRLMHNLIESLHVVNYISYNDTSVTKRQKFALLIPQYNRFYPFDRGILPAHDYFVSNFDMLYQQSLHVVVSFHASLGAPIRFLLLERPFGMSMRHWIPNIKSVVTCSDSLEVS